MIKTNTLDSVSFSSMYKVRANDILNIHVHKEFLFTLYAKFFKCLEVQSNVHLPTLSSLGKNKSVHSCTFCM